jgi:hypothetical protein
MSRLVSFILVWSIIGRNGKSPASMGVLRSEIKEIQVDPEKAPFSVADAIS